MKKIIYFTPFLLVLVHGNLFGIEKRSNTSGARVEISKDLIVKSDKGLLIGKPSFAAYFKVYYLWILENDGCYHLWRASVTNTIDNTGFPVPAIEWTQMTPFNYIGTTARFLTTEVFESLC